MLWCTLYMQLHMVSIQKAGYNTGPNLDSPSCVNCVISSMAMSFHPPWKLLLLGSQSVSSMHLYIWYSKSTRLISRSIQSSRHGILCLKIDYPRPAKYMENRAGQGKHLHLLSSKIISSKLEMTRDRWAIHLNPYILSTSKTKSQNATPKSKL